MPTPIEASVLAGQAKPARLTKSERTRQQLVDAAASALRQYGYSNTSLAVITEIVGIHAASIYYHFKSKEELVEEVLRVGNERIIGYVKDAVDALPADSSPRERLLVAVRAHLKILLEIGDYASAAIRIRGEIPAEIQKRHRAYERRYGQYWLELLEAGRDAGEIRDDLDLPAVRSFLTGAMNWSTEWYQPRGPSAEELGDQLASVVLNGIATKPVRRPRSKRASGPGSSTTGSS